MKLQYLNEGRLPFDWRGCLMLEFPDVARTMVNNFTSRFIPEDKIVEGEKFVHTTVLYGFPQDTQFKDLERFLENIDPITLTLGEISIFPANENRSSDVWKIEVESITLRQLHEDLKTFFGVETDYPNYNPHCTLGYLVPGTPLDIPRDYFVDTKVTCDKMVYSIGSSVDRIQKSFSLFRNGDFR